MKISQKDRVVNKLKTDGSVDNFWAIDNYILRLGAIIHTLTKDGWVFDRKFKDGTKDFVYSVISYPSRQLNIF